MKDIYIRNKVYFV